MTNLFQKEIRDYEEKIRRNFRIIYDVNDLLAGILFTIGSVLFFGESTQHIATWLFLIGSLQFVLRPGIKVVRDIRIIGKGKKRGNTAARQRQGL